MLQSFALTCDPIAALTPLRHITTFLEFKNFLFHESMQTDFCIKCSSLSSVTPLNNWHLCRHIRANGHTIANEAMGFHLHLAHSFSFFADIDWDSVRLFLFVCVYFHFLNASLLHILSSNIFRLILIKGHQNQCLSTVKYLTHELFHLWHNFAVQYDNRLIFNVTCSSGFIP